VPAERRGDAYRFIRREILKGKQAYIVYPLVEESDKLPLSAAEEMAKHLQNDYFSDVPLALLHGRMNRDRRMAVMESFRKGETKVLIATSVVEVGLDVPNACIMFVEHAERFGLSQLHQLRGRIGRGRKRSYFLYTGSPVTEEAQKRLSALKKTSDGFKIAELDLQIRGPGAFFSERQHGMPDLKLGSLFNDTGLLMSARTAAEGLVSEDRRLAQSGHALLRGELLRRFKGRFLMGVTG
jgi:ATP-dependent DNA helicase RecG